METAICGRLAPSPKHGLLQSKPANPSSSGTGSSAEASDGGLVKKSAASMLSGKKPAPTAPGAKKVTSKKADEQGHSQTKTSGQPEDVEPGQMSLEEIETRLGSLIKPETLAGLKGATWQKRLEGITSLKNEVEALQELDQSVEILIRLICDVPGWSEKHAKVLQSVIEVVNHIASTASKFSKKCVVLCIGVSKTIMTRGGQAKEDGQWATYHYSFDIYFSVCRYV